MNRAILAFCLFILGFSVSAATLNTDPQNSYTLNITDNTTDPIGQHIQFFHEDNINLNLKSAQARFNTLNTSRSRFSALSLGLDKPPTWLHINVNNATQAPISKRLLIETSWLDQIEIFVVTNQQLVKSVVLGDKFPFQHRLNASPHFSMDHAYLPGISDIYMRISTPDPMNLPIYFITPQAAEKRFTFQAYSYGLIYGAALSLFLYNFILYIGLNSKRHLFFSFYLMSFVLANLSYTGHGYQWLWPNNAEWQRWSNPVLMMTFNICGLLFALVFLNLKRHTPKLRKGIITISAVFIAAQAIAIMFGMHSTSVKIAFVFMLMFSTFMIFLGAYTLKYEPKSALYFLLASIAGSLGSTITASSVLGIVPYSSLTYRAVEIGIMVDMTLLALALAAQFRHNERVKNQAQLLARTDPLTQLNNRRAFQERAQSLWELSCRENKPQSLIVLDVDHFKSINDRFGHAVGDEVLAKIGRQLKAEIRACDIAARWGGEEFILYLYDTSMPEAITVAKKLQRVIENLSIVAKNNPIQVTASFGVASRIGTHATLEALINAADHELYCAKDQGRNQVCYPREPIKKPA